MTDSISAEAMMNKFMSILEPNNKQTGGANEDTPNGGFLPIFKCDKKDIITQEENKNREFKGTKNAVSIKDIMKKRRDPKSSIFS
jgi:hypothetical protein